MTVDAAGTYTLTVTNTTTGCSSADQANVVVDQELPVADAGADMQINCDQPEIRLDGTSSQTGSGIRYRWRTSDGNIVSGASSMEPLVDQAGVYELTVTNTASGCTQIDQVTVTGNAQPPVADAGANQNITCQNPQVTLGGNVSQNTGATNLAFQWTTSDGNIVGSPQEAQVTVDQSGTYRLTVTNTLNNCQTEDIVQVTGSAAPPEVNAGSDRIVTLGESVQLEGVSDQAISFQWSPAALFDNPNVANPTITPSTTVVVTLLVTDANGCTAEDQVTLTVPIVEDLVIPNSFSPNGDGVNDRWNIPGIEYLGSYNLEIYNRLGNRVYSGPLGWDGTYNGEVLPTGTYFYSLKFSDLGARAGHVNLIK